MERAPSGRLYPERPGVNIEQALATMQSAPEIQLTPEAEQETRQFEENLTRGELLDKQGQRVEPLEKLWELKVHRATLFAEYLQTAEGRELWQETTGTVMEGETPTDITQTILRTNYESIPVQAIQKLQQATRTYAEAQVLDQFAASGFSDVQNISNPTKVTIVRNPATLVEKIAGLRQLKHYQRGERRKL